MHCSCLKKNDYVVKGLWKNGFHKRHPKQTKGYHHRTCLKLGQGNSGNFPRRNSRFLKPDSQFWPTRATCFSYFFFFLIEFLATSWGLCFLQVWDNPSYFLLLLPSVGLEGRGEMFPCKHWQHWENRCFPSGVGLLSLLICISSPPPPPLLQKKVLVPFQLWLCKPLPGWKDLPAAK